MTPLEKWSVVEKAVRYGSIYNADLQTLETYRQYITVAPGSQNPAYNAKLDRIATGKRNPTES